MQNRQDDSPGSSPRRSSGSTASGGAQDEEDYMGSSTSTAGPPPDSNLHTGRFTRPQWSLVTGKQQGSEAASYASSASTHTLKINHTEGYRAGAGPEDSSTSSHNGSQHNRGRNSRTMSNASVSVSPMGSSGSPQEWGRSFRLFNTSRVWPSASNSRQRDGSPILMYRNTFMHPHHGRANSIGPDSERPYLNGSMFHHPQNSFFGGGRMSFWATDNNNASAILTAASTFSGFHPGASISGTPLLGALRHTSTAFFPRSGSNRHAVHRAIASCAMGNTVCQLSPAQVELPLAMDSLRAHIGMCGKTIICGDADHPLEIRKGPLIGAGGFAKVFAGVNVLRGELVAIKEIDISGVEDVAALNEIEAEFALLKSLHHPNIVSYSLFEHSKSQQVCRIVMELLAGDSTLHLLQKFGPLTEPVLRIMTRSILRAIRFIHKEGIFHRDIKPANILVSHRGEVKLCDFGCSKRVSELNKAASCIIGTPVYMAPEFIKGEANHKADIWSMACSLFELATGLAPWYHSGVRDNLPLMFYITTTYDSPMAFPTQDTKSEYSPEFINFMEVCFNRNVDKRPEAEELLKHPWITGGRLPAVVNPPSVFLTLHQDTAFAGLKAFGSPGKSSAFSSPRDSAVDHDDVSLSGSDGMQKSASTAPTLNPIEEEVACQQELEGVAAATALDLCSVLVSPSPDVGLRNSQEALPLEGGSGTDDTSPSLPRTASTPSPALSHRGAISVNAGDIPSPVLTPEHSMVHDNFYYSQVPLGASGGNFVLPFGLDLDGAPPLQQYLRINEEGNLDMVHLPEEELEDSGHHKSFLGDASYGTMHHGRTISPARNSSFSRGSLSPRLSFGYNNNSSAAADQDGTVPQPITNNTFSSGESPSRSGGVSVPTSPHGIPAPPLLFRSTILGATTQLDSQGGSPLMPHTSPNSAFKSGSNRDVATPHSPRSESPVSMQRSESFQNLPEKLKAQADGKLHMSFSVSTAPGHALSVELNVDVADVQCKVVDNQPNYVVAFTDNVRSQIANKIKEVSVPATPPSLSPHLPPHGSISPGSASSNTEGHGTMPENHFYHGNAFSSASRPILRPLSGVPAGSTDRLFVVPHGGGGGGGGRASRSVSSDESSGANSRASSPAVRASNSHATR